MGSSKVSNDHKDIGDEGMILDITLSMILLLLQMQTFLNWTTNFTDTTTEPLDSNLDRNKYWI